VASLRFSPVSYTNKTYRHGITEILYSILYLIHGYSLAIKCKTISKLLDETVEYSALMVFISFKLDKKQILNETFFLTKKNQVPFLFYIVQQGAKKPST
jgi:hypothetical protein